MARYAFSLIGGDLRIAWLAQHLAYDGHIVKLYGQEENDFSFDSSVIHCCDMETAIHDSDAIILGIPCSKDKTTIYAPFASKPILLNDLLLHCNKQYIFGGMLPYEYENAIDYANDESFLWANAIPTAEGALQLLMQHSPAVITGSRVAILGFGRIAIKTAQLLSLVGAHITVYARSSLARAQASTLGFIAKNLDEIQDNLIQYDAVLNTIPSMILDADTLYHARSDTLFMELASTPGGFDQNAIHQYQLSYISAGGLPGKVAPKTAAQYIKNTVLNRLEELL